MAGAARGTAAHVVVDTIDELVLAGDDRHHLEAVLRLRPGEPVSATDGRGGLRLCRFAAGGALEADGPAARVARPAPELTVGLAAVKGDRTEWAVQKLTELGIDRIAVLATDRSVVRWAGQREASHLSRLRRVAREALRQSRGVWLPDVSVIGGIEELASLPGVSMAEPGGGAPNLSHPVVMIGPEGGWSDAELDLGLPRVGLGDGVLRTESAAVAAGVLLTALRSGLVRAVHGR